MTKSEIMTKLISSLFKNPNLKSGFVDDLATYNSYFNRFETIADKILESSNQGIYTEKEFKERLEYIKTVKNITFSEQYGNYLLLDDENNILLNITSLIKED